MRRIEHLAELGTAVMKDGCANPVGSPCRGS